MCNLATRSVYRLYLRLTLALTGLRQRRSISRRPGSAVVKRAALTASEQHYQIYSYNNKWSKSTNNHRTVQGIDYSMYIIMHMNPVNMCTVVQSRVIHALLDMIIYISSGLVRENLFSAYLLAWYSSFVVPYNDEIMYKQSRACNPGSVLVFINVWMIIALVNLYTQYICLQR